MVNTIQMTQTGYDELAKELGYDAGFGAGVGNFSLGAQDDNPGDHLFGDRFGGGGDDAGILPLRQNDHFGAFAGAFFQRVQNRHFSILSV